MGAPSLRDYRALAEFRHRVRLFLSFSEASARAAGVEPQQHQLLLACKGLPTGSRPTIRTLAARLCLEHNTVVQMVDKLVRLGFVRRVHGVSDRREVLVEISDAGETLLSQLSSVHREQLRIAGAALHRAIGAILTTYAQTRASRSARPRAAARRAVARSAALPARPRKAKAGR